MNIFDKFFSDKTKTKNVKQVKRKANHYPVKKNKNNSEKITLSNGYNTCVVESEKIIAELLLGGNNYVMHMFNLEFLQDLDKHNKPDSLPYGGNIELWLSGSTDDLIEEWIIFEDKKHNGEIKIYMQGTKNQTDILSQIAFTNARCIKYSKFLDIKTGQNITGLSILPQSVWVNKAEYSCNN
jgi:hypothetical protein